MASTSHLPPRYVIHVDQELTRRKAFHILADEDGEHVRHARRISDLMEWLDQQGETAYFLHLPGDREPALICHRL